MVEETNRYAAQTFSAAYSAWTPTNVPGNYGIRRITSIYGHQQKTSIQHALVHVRRPAKSPVFVDHVSQ